MSVESVMPSHLLICRPLSLCLHSFPASGTFPMSWLFPSERQGAIAPTGIIIDTWATGLLELYGNFLQISVIFFSIQLETSSYADHNDGNRCIRNQRRQEAGVRDLGKLRRKFITVSSMNILHVCGQPLKVRPVRMGLQIPSSLLPLKDTGVP